jgi:hypothetical protein
VAVGDRKASKGNADSDSIGSIKIKPADHVLPSDTCAVCLESLKKSNTRALVCGHIFHHDCVAGIESFGLLQKCPLCRSDLPDAGLR